MPSLNDVDVQKRGAVPGLWRTTNCTIFQPHARRVARRSERDGSEQEPQVRDEDVPTRQYLGRLRELQRPSILVLPKVVILPGS